MEQSNRTTTVKPGASSQESAIALLTHAVEALRNHPQDAHAGLVAGRIVNYLKTFPTHAVVAYLVKGEGDQEAVLHMVPTEQWPAWAKHHRCWNEGATTEETGDAFAYGYLAGHDDADLVDRVAAALPLVTELERKAIDGLLSVAYAAWNLADNTEDSGGTDLAVTRANFTELETALDTLEQLPDDQPGYTMAEAAKARWALRRLIGPGDAPPPAEPAEPLFYLQDTRQYVGNCPMWWRPEGKGYTTRLDEAWKMTRAAAFGQQAARETDVPWPCEQIDALLRPTIDMQDLRGLKTGDPAP